MMGSRPQVPVYSTYPIQERNSEPEEYDLDTYTLPVDANVSLALKGIKLRNNKETGPNLRFPIKKKLQTELHGRLPIDEIPNSESGIKTKKKSLYPFRASNKTVKKASKISENSSVGDTNFSGYFHNDSAANSSCVSHVFVKKEGERQSRTLQPGGSSFAVMGDVDGGMGGNGRTGGRKHHYQPTFLKTVSIIDTLSELGPEVRQLAEEPIQKLAAKPPPVGGSRNTKNPPEDSSRLEFLHSGPPSVSVDFQQYTEKIYDAVTRRSEVLPSNSRLRNPQKSNLKSDSAKILTIRNNYKDKNGLRGEPADRIRKIKRGRERGRTPDWIKRIFDIAKRGNLEEFKQGVSDMEDTLVRNLSDHAGNNLLHVMAVYGHLPALAWILSSQSLLLDALHDENKYGLTPLVCSIKYDRLHVVQWLVENTCIKDKIKCKDGERSLLHIASKYAQEEIVAWLVDYMMSHEISLDNKDHHGNTALHLVARTGNSRVCSILLQHGADVTLKNDLGQKAWEVCVIRGHLACAEYLCVHESGLALATDLTRREAELEAAMADNHDLRLNFKEVMNIARRLIREREEAVRELSKLHEQMIEAHDNIMALNVLSDDQSSSYKGNKSSSPQRDQVESVIRYVTNLHERWQTIQKSWFGSSLVHMKHRMLLVEEAWKKLRHRSHRTVATTHHPLDVFRGKLCAVRAQGGEGRLGDLPSLCSSEESLASLFPFSEEEEDEENNYETLPASSTPAKASSSGAGFGAHKRAEVAGYNELAGAENLSIAKFHKDDDLIYSGDKNNLTASNMLSPIESSKNQVRPYWTDPNLSTSLNIASDLSPGQHLPKDEINSKLKEYALTSESGSCSVLEVIEPSSGESEPLADEEGLNLLDDHFGEEILMEPKSKSSHDWEDKRILRSRWENGEVPGRGDGMASSETDSHSSRELPHHNKTTERNHFLTLETSVGAAAADVSNKEQRLGEQEDGQDLATGIPFKRRGFLHKFIKPPHWPSKRKVKSIRKLDQGIAHNLFVPTVVKETNRLTDISYGDKDPQTTPESNTSSSQEYSNSSEESSIGKVSSRPTESQMSYSHHIDPESNSIISCSNNVQDTEKKIEKAHLIPLHKLSVHSNSPPPVPSRRAVLSPILSETSNKDYHSDRVNPIIRLDNSVKLAVSEARSIATSEDSGIVAVARPSSSTSKSESASRPDSSSSNFPSFKNDYLLQKSNLSLTQDMLPTPDSSTAGRMSPAPSEVSKTESALSPPSDVSKSESSRQTSLGKGSLGSSTNSNCSKDGSAGSSDYSVTPLSKKDIDVKTASIININCDQKVLNPSQTDMTEAPAGLQRSKKERPWYELSDEESDILLPDRLSSNGVPHSTSSEDEAEIC